MLGIGCRGIATHVIKKAGFYRKTAKADAVTLIDDARPCASPFIRLAASALVDLESIRDWCAELGCHTEHGLGPDHPVQRFSTDRARAAVSQRSRTCVVFCSSVTMLD